MWNELIKTLGITAFIVTGIVWLARSIFKHILSKDIEKYKIKLGFESDQKIEELRNQLKILSLEHEIRFSRLHDKRALIIAEMYEKLIDAVNAATDYVSFVDLAGEPSKDKKFEIAITKISTFYQYYNKRKIFLSKQLCDQIKQFSDKLWKPTHELSLYIGDMGFAKRPDGDYDDVWMEAWNSISGGEIPQAVQALEAEFRNLLGVENA
jgi:hypothetical protein